MFVFIRNGEKDKLDERKEAKYNAKGFQPMILGFWTLKLYKSKYSLKIYKNVKFVIYNFWCV